MFDYEAVPIMTMDEQLIRFVVYESHIKRYQNGDKVGEYVHWRGLKPNKGGVSVTRRLCCTNDELKCLGDIVARNARKDMPDAEVVAYAKSTVKECTSVDHFISVREEKLDDNPNHANILQADPGENEQIQMTIDHFLSSNFTVMRVLDEPDMVAAMLNV